MYFILFKDYRIPILNDTLGLVIKFSLLSRN